ncbi:glycosyl hydrolase 108 family protein [Methylotenera sp.]|uniref:glycosyl hydrolase 108 family protein n=1 Tax=Methylotenera sp. TaxID=2051956 RepID=UPI002ED954AA
MASFEPAYNYSVVGYEGGYRNFAWDDETYRGINRAAWPTWSGWAIVDARKPVQYNQVFTDLENMVKAFYRANFWNAMNGDYINSQQMANLVYDYFMASGTYGLKKVQMAINSVLPTAMKIDVDGVLGPQTINALNSSYAGAIYNAIIDTRKVHYQNLLQQGVLSPNDWNGIWKRITSFPTWVAANKGKAAIGGVLLLAGIGATIYLVNRNHKQAA